MVENDFGAIHGKTYLVEAEDGTHLAAFYAGDTWWEGHNDQGCKVQTKYPIVRIVGATNA